MQAKDPYKDRKGPEYEKYLKDHPLKPILPTIYTPPPASNKQPSNEPYTSYTPEDYEYWTESLPKPITVGMEMQFDPRNVDWLHLVTNGAGVISDFASLLVGIGVVEVAPIAEWGFIIDCAGLAVDVYNVFEENDYTGLTIDTIKLIAKETKAARIVPLYGFTYNAGGVLDAWNAGYSRVFNQYTPPPRVPHIGPPR